MKIKDINGLYVAETEKKFRILIAAEDMNHARKLAREYFEEAGHESADFKVRELSYYADPNLICFDCDYIICEGKPSQKEKARPTLTETIFAILQDPSDFEFNLYWVTDNDVKDNRLTDFFGIKPNGAESGVIKKSEFFKKHIPFFGIMIKSLIVSFDTIASARVIKCNGIEENGKKRYDIYISGDIYKFTVRNAIDDCSLKYGNNMNLEVMSDCLVKISNSSDIFLSSSSLGCLRSTPKYYARLDDLNVRLKIYTSYREYRLADIVDAEVKHISVENTACGQICHIVAYEPDHKNVIDREASLSEYSGKIIIAEDMNFYLNSLYKLEEITDLSNNNRVDYHFYNDPRLESSAKKEVNIDKLDEDDTYIFQFRYYADKHRMEVGLSPVRYRDPKYTINEQQKAEQPNCCTRPIEKDVVRESIEQTLRGITDPLGVQEYHGLVPAEDLPEETKPVDVEIHHDEYNVERKVSMLYIAEVAVADAKYILHVYSPFEDMVKSLVFIFINDIGYTNDDVTAVVIHSCDEILDKKVDTVLFGGEDVAYPADYELIGIYDADKLTVYINKVDQEEPAEEAPEMEFDRFYHNCHIDKDYAKINIASLFLVELEISSKMDKGETGNYKIAVYCESEDMIGEIILAFLDDIGYDEEDMTSMTFKPFKDASNEEMLDKYQYTIVVQKKLNSDKYDMWIDNGFNPPEDEEPVKNDEEEEMDNILTVEEFVNSKVHDTLRCMINYYLSNEYNGDRPGDGVLDNDPEDETILFTTINNEGYKILREDFLKSEIEDICTDPIDGCKLAVYINPKYAEKMQTFNIKSIALDLDAFVGKKVNETVESILAFGASVSDIPVRITYYDASDRRVMRSDIKSENIYLVNCSSEGKTEYKTISEYLAVINPEKHSLINTYHCKDTRRVDVVERYKYLTQDDLYNSRVIAIHQGVNQNDKKNGRLTYFIGVDTGKMICKDINYDVYKNHTIRCAGSMLKYKDLPILEPLTESKGRDNAVYKLTAIDRGAFIPIIPTVNGFYLNGIELKNFGEWMIKSIEVSGNNIELYFEAAEVIKEAEDRRKKIKEVTDIIRNSVTEAGKKYKFEYNDKPADDKFLEDFTKEFAKAAAEASNVPVDMLPVDKKAKDKREETIEIIKKYFCTPVDPADANKLPNDFHVAWVKAKIMAEIIENYDAFSKVMEILWKVFKEYPNLGK